jgi:hypothetical protein
MPGLAVITQQETDKEASMIWSAVRQAYPHQWLIVEALAAHTEGCQRKLDQIAVIETCTDGAAAMRSYQRLHREYPTREFYFVHTTREDLDIRERRWIGVRRADDELRPEYDLSELLKGGVRGKHVERYREGTNLVLLAPDVAAEFPDETAVNEALRLVMQLARIPKGDRHSMAER